MALMTSPVIVELALNGATPRARNRHVPRTPEEIAEVALEGIDLGASIVHNHNDEPMFTLDAVHAAEPYVAAWEPVLARHPDVLLYPTMGAGARGIPVQRRWAHVEELARRGLGGMTLVDPGSVNVGLTCAGEVPEAAAAGPYLNSYLDLEYMFARSAALGRRAQHLDLRAGLPAHHADLAPARQGPARRDREAVLRRRAGVRPAADPDRPGGLPGDAGAVRAAVVGGRARRRRRGVRAGRARDPPRRARPGGPGGLRRARRAVQRRAAAGRGRAHRAARARRPPRSRETRALLGVPRRCARIWSDMFVPGLRLRRMDYAAAVEFFFAPAPADVCHPRGRGRRHARAPPPRRAGADRDARRLVGVGERRDGRARARLLPRLRRGAGRAARRGARRGGGGDVRRVRARGDRRHVGTRAAPS